MVRGCVLIKTIYELLPGGFCILFTARYTVQERDYYMRQYYLIPLAIGLIALGAACGKKTANTGAANANTSMAVNTNETVVNTNSASINTNRAINTNTSANTNAAVTTSGSLTITQPVKNSELESPFIVAGKSSATTVYARVKNATGAALFTETLTVRNGEYSAYLTLSLTHTTSGTVEVFEKDAAGNETNLVSVPVTFKVVTTTTSTNTNGSAANENANQNTNGSFDTNY